MGGCRRGDGFGFGVVFVWRISEEEEEERRASPRGTEPILPIELIAAIYESHVIYNFNFY